METAVTRLRESLGELLQYYPLVLRNVFHSSSSVNTIDADVSPSPHDENHMADAVEGFLTELTRALSIGLREGDGFELWSVLELLECVPDRMQAAAEAEASAVKKVVVDRSPVGRSQGGPSRSPASVSSQRTLAQCSTSVLSATSATPHTTTTAAAAGAGATPLVGSRRDTVNSSATWQHHLQRFHFASQLVYVVRSTFPAAPRPLLARVLLRLALNQGCLLAALELLRRWCRTELEGFYEPMFTASQSASADAKSQQTTSLTGPPVRAVGTTNNHSNSGGKRKDVSVAFLVQPDTDSDMWNSFVAALAPVGGPPIDEIAAGAPKTSAQPFHLQLVVAGLDDDTTASLEYYTQLQSYLRGRRVLRPSALMCYEASQRRSAQTTAAVAEATAATPVNAAAKPRRASAVPAQQHILQVEALPVAHVPSHRTRRSVEGGGGGGGEDTAATAAALSECSSQSTRQRHRRRRRKHTRTSTSESATAMDCAAGLSRLGDADAVRDGEGSSGEDGPFTASHRSFPMAKGRHSHCSSSSASAASREHKHRHHHASTVRCDGTAAGVEVAQSEERSEPAADLQRSSSMPQETHVAECATRAVVDATDDTQQQQWQASADAFARSDLSVVTTAVFNEDAPSTGRGVLSSVRAELEEQQQQEQQYRQHLHEGAFLAQIGQLSRSDAATSGSAAGSIETEASLPSELADLQRRVLQCWRVAVAHAESQERKRLMARDADANDAATTH